MNKLLTAKLNNGMTALARATKYGVYATTYANRTQAEKAAAKLQAAGVACWVCQLGWSVVFYVIIGTAE